MRSRSDAEMSSSSVTSIAELRQSLDAVIAAVGSADATALFAAEARLESAVTALSTLTPADVVNRDVVRLELQRARASLQRCRVVGHTVMDVVQGLLGALGMTSGYLPPGVRVESPRLGRLNTRV